MKEKIQQLIRKSKNLHILYVEDNPETRESMLHMLNRFFDYVSSAVDGQDGIDQFDSNIHDLVLTDLNMPKLNGMDMIAKIRTIDTNIPILLLSAHNETSYTNQTKQFDIEGYLFKPIELKQFLEILNKVVDKIGEKEEHKEIEHV